MKTLKKTLAALLVAAMTMALIAVPAMAETIRGMSFTAPMDLEQYKQPDAVTPWVAHTGWAEDNGVLKGEDWIDYRYAVLARVKSDGEVIVGEDAQSGMNLYHTPEEINFACAYDRGLYSISDLDADGWTEVFIEGFGLGNRDAKISKTSFEQHNGVDYFRVDYDMNGIQKLKLVAPSESGDVFFLEYNYDPSTNIPQKYEQDFWDVMETVTIKQKSVSTSSGGSTATPAPAVTAAPSSGKNAEDYHLLASTFNKYTVYNGPTEETAFNIDEDTLLQAITTYHWNGGNGKAPGSIALLENGVKVGEWQATSRGSSGKDNTLWDVFPDYTLKGGNRYTIVDSDNDTWSTNSDSYDMGFVEIRGYGLGTVSGSTTGSAANTTAPAAGDDTIKIYVNGSRVYPDSDPVIISDRTLVPIRVVAEALGYKVDWDGTNQIVDVHNDDMSLRMMIGSTSLARYLYDYNGNISGTDVVNADVAPQIINERTYLPLRAVGEALGAEVDWDGNTRSVYISGGAVG